MDQEKIALRDLTPPEDDIEVKDKLWLAARIREQWAELVHMRHVLRHISNYTSPVSRVGKLARSGLSWPNGKA